MSTSKQRYWAFISYSSKDSALAKKLHRRLEAYRFPRDLIGRPGRDKPIPKKIFPVFRDREELPLSSDLGTSIEDALRESRYLIVICSPHAANSRWVNEEIRFFKSLGRSDRILALIIDGEPNGDEKPELGKQECFPEALKYEIDDSGDLTSKRSEPIAGDLRRGGDGWRQAFLKVVAGVAGVGLDTIVRRERKRTRRRLILAATVGLLTLGSTLWVWDAYYRTHVRYFRQARSSFQGFEGIGPLSKAELKDRWTAVEFIHRGRQNPVSEIRSVGGNGQPIAPLLPIIASSILGQQLQSNYSMTNQRPICHVLLTRDGSGNLVKKEAFYIDGSPAYEFRYLDPNTISFQVEGIERRREAGIASRAKITYRDKPPFMGGLKEVRFMDAYGNPAELDVGAEADKLPGPRLYGFRIEAEEGGETANAIRMYFLDAEWNPFTFGGVLYMTTELDDENSANSVSIWANDPSTHKAFVAQRMQFEHGKLGEVGTIVTQTRPSAEAAPIEQRMIVDLAHSRMEANEQGNLFHTYLGDTGRKLLEELKFDVIGFLWEDEILVNVLLMPSTKYRNGFYDMPGRIFVKAFPDESPGRQSGLQVGDLLLSYMDTEIHEIQELLDIITKHGDRKDPVRIEILRDGQRINLDVPPGKLGISVGRSIAHTRESFKSLQ